MANSRKRVLELNQSRIDAAEARAAAEIRAAYRQARGELVATLTERWGGQTIIGAVESTDLQRRMGIINEIDARLQQLGYETGQIMASHVNDAGELALEQIRREMALLPSELTLNTARFAGVNVLMIEQYVPLAVTEAISITTASAGVLGREMRLGLIQGESLPELTARLFNVTGASPWKRGQLDAELFTRRVVIHANNGAKAEAIRSLGDPTLQKQAIAVIGDTTTDTCLRVHGQIVDVDKPFVLTGTPRFADQMMHPGFHWNCRTSIAMYHPAFERSGLTTTNMIKSAQAQLKRNNAA